MKKGLLVGAGLSVLIGGGIFGLTGAFADSNQSQTNSSQTVQAPQTGNQHLGKRFNFLNQHKDQIHQINQIKEDRTDLTKQIIQKRDQLLDLLLAAKNSGNKQELKQAKTVRQQLKTLNQDIRSLQKDGRTDQKSINQAIKNNTDGTTQINQLIATQQQINDKMKERIAQLDQLISIFSAKTGI